MLHGAVVPSRVERAHGKLEGRKGRGVRGEGAQQRRRQTPGWTTHRYINRMTSISKNKHHIALRLQGPTGTYL